MEGARVHLLTDEQLHAYAAAAARAAVRQVLDELAPLLPPFSQYALPPDCRRKDFLAAVAAGCSHRKRGRVVEVSRADWTAWLSARTASRPIPIEASLAGAANDAAPSAPPKTLDIDALTAEALRPRRG